MKQTNRRNFLGRGAATAAAAAAVVAVPAAAQGDKPTKKVLYKDGKKPAPSGKPALYSSTIAFGNLLFISGVGAHVEGDIKSHTKIVLDSIQQQLESVGSSMDKVLKCNVYLADLKDYAAMNETFAGRFGAEPPVRTTIAAAGVPGNSLVEIDVIAYI